VLSASRHSRAVPSWWPLTMPGVPSGSTPHRHRHHLAVVAGEDLVGQWPGDRATSGSARAGRGRRAMRAAGSWRVELASINQPDLLCAADSYSFVSRRDQGNGGNSHCQAALPAWV